MYCVHSNCTITCRMSHYILIILDSGQQRLIKSSKGKGSPLYLLRSTARSFSLGVYTHVEQYVISNPVNPEYSIHQQWYSYRSTLDDRQ